MPSFEYEATRADGERVTSVAIGRSIEEVLQNLSQQGLQVVRIQDAYSQHDPLRNVAVQAQPAAPEERSSVEYADNEAMPVPPAPLERPSMYDESAPPLRELPPLGKRNVLVTNLLGPLVAKVPLRELSFFFRQFGTMVEAGVPMVQTLATLGNQSRHFKLRKIILEMSRAVDAGLPISAIMQRYPEAFTPLVISLIRAGEEGGFLAESSKSVSQYLDHEMELRNLYKRETFMPKLYLIASIGIIAGTNLLIASMGLKGGLSSPLNNIETWYVLGPLIIGIFLWFRVGLSFYAIKRYWDMFMLYIPYLGKTIHHFAMAKFGRAFGALYKGGVPVTRAVLLAADASGNEWIRSRIYPAIKEIEGGAGISDTLASTHVFSQIVLNMMSTGETTGSLDQMLTKMSEFYEEEGKLRARQTANVMGVAVMLGVGIYVGYIVIGFYSGYFQAIFNAAGNP